MKLQEFKRKVHAEFGSGLAHATPANVREFLDRMQLEAFRSKTEGRIVIDEPSRTYEEIIRDFFSRVLESPPEEAVMVLWSLALDLSFAAIEYQYAERFSQLFREIEPE